MSIEASADTRTLREKMEDRLRLPGSSLEEIEFARRWLDAHPKRVLGREEILATPDSRASVRQVRYYDSRLGAWVTMEVDVVDAVVDEYLARRDADEAY